MILSTVYTKSYGYITLSKDLNKWGFEITGFIYPIKKRINKKILTYKRAVAQYDKLKIKYDLR